MVRKLGKRGKQVLIRGGVWRKEYGTWGIVICA